MVDWTYIPDESARWKGRTKRKPFQPLKARLKHKLEHDRADDHWRCTVKGCGYVLGVHGHAALYGQCPFKPLKQVVRDRRLTPVEAKKYDRIRKQVSQEFQAQGELLLEQQHNNKKRKRQR
jgi:hypothetical protein